ncbi:class I SAM-dependent methyltransferase [Paenibacillus sp. PK4536]|uniref:tRNA (mnm(5)s(2)U34)-methyltransferase n=1 Tax=Paenibacillus sp. PK4536 TaxID=3024576 RepID=UPI0023597A92|nr:class I SAM-dependent methyltransferase [Paenibacillus sp. PK4536]WIM37368.1 class I SAM-dependent methyltransferase [Paenibacillus sp. PK4536]
MGFLSVLSYAHKLVLESLDAHSGYAIDATAGTGVDTLMLAKAAGRRGQVFSFDIQQDALDRTQERLDKEDQAKLASVQLILDSHATMSQYIPEAQHGKIQVIMFNLGYLPTGDPSIITEPESTLTALASAFDLLAIRGILTIVLYPGHAGGAEEAKAVQDWASSLPVAVAQSIIYRQLQRQDAPYLIAIEKKGSSTP